jgi:hypothetical protein
VGDRRIEVRTDKLSEFAGEVRFEAGEVLEPAVTRNSVPLRDGVTFGARNASGAVHSAKVKYAQSLAASMANLNEFVEAAKIMAAAAEKVAAEFDAVDVRSSAAVDRVNALLSQAVGEAQAARIAREHVANPYGEASRTANGR